MGVIQNGELLRRAEASFVFLLTAGSSNCSTSEKLHVVSHRYRSDRHSPDSS